MSKQSGKKYQSGNSISSRTNSGELRIIAGKWRSRKLSFPAADGLRPTPARIRETLFNWLTPDLPGSHCLDLFAGSGALGFEALSRGADSITMIEQNSQITRQLQNNKQLLDAQNLQILNQDAMNLSTIKGAFDIIFCDPPFNKNFIQPLISAIHNSSLLRENAKLYIETEKNLASLELPESWTLLKEKTAGDVRYRLIDVGERLLTQ